MKNKIALVAFFIIFAVGIFTGCTKASYLENKESDVAEEESASTTEKSSCSSSLESVFVQVAGAVNSPGVYELKGDARVYEAIDAAGGLSEDADDIDLNQAATVVDGQKIYVFHEGERETALADSSGTSEGQADSSGLLNINTASAEELTTLSGIGPSKAESIVSYRTENGAFSKTDDLMNVDGIGEGTYSKIRDKITV